MMSLVLLVIHLLMIFGVLNLHRAEIIHNRTITADLTDEMLSTMTEISDFVVSCSQLLLIESSSENILEDKVEDLQLEIF